MWGPGFFYSIETSVSQNATFKIGVVCNSITSIPENWSSITSYSNKFSYTLPTIPQGVDVEAWIGFCQVKAGAVTGNLNQPTTTVTLSSPASVWLSPVYKYRG